MAYESLELTVRVVAFLVYGARHVTEEEKIKQNELWSNMGRIFR